MGDKHTRDLISDNVKMSVTGNTVKVSGDVKTITKKWTEFDKSGNNTGHFFPMLLPTECVGQEVTLKGRTGSDRTVKVDQDRLLIVRLENLSGTTLTIEMGGKTLMEVDFTGVIPTGESARDPDKTDFGSYGKLEQFVSGLNIAWTGVKGKVTGELLKFAGNEKVKEGHHFPLGMSAWYADGVEKMLNGKKVTDKDIIVAISSKDTPITVKYNGLTVMELDLSAMTLGS